MASPVRKLQSSAHHLLFVDDDPAMRQLTPMLLQRQGYEVSCASDGIEGLQLIKASTPDLIISDLRMPRMSGFEFLSVVRRKFPRLPTIAISGEFLNGTETMGIADAFFVKGSYSPNVLCNKIAELLADPPVHAVLHSPPIWVPVGPSGEVILTCTDCLRSFAVRVCPPELGNPLRETDCVACGAHLQYCVDKTALKLGATAWETCGLLKIANPKSEF